MQRIQRDVARLRPLPTSLAQIVRALEDPTTTPNKLAEMITLDQSLTADVLRLANSAAMDYVPPSRTMQEAVMRLGYARIKTMVLGVHASPLLTRALSGYQLGAAELWEHSVTAATIARTLSRALSFNNAEEAYIAGLLHDMGKLVLDQYLAADYANMLAFKQKHNLRLWQVEQKLFGLDHGAVGGALATKWNFPRSLAEAIEFHHWPTFASHDQELAAIINIADAWANAAGGDARHFGEAVYHPESPRLLNVTEATLERIRASLKPVAAPVALPERAVAPALRAAAPPPPQPKPEKRRGFFGFGRRN